MVLVDLRNREGCEQRGIRPAVVIQNNKGNEHSTTTIIAPLTTKVKSPYLPTHVNINTEEDSVVMLEQIVTIDNRRILSYLDKVSEEDMREIDKAILISLGLS